MMEFQIKKLLDVLPYYVLLIDSDHHILFANKAVQQQLQVDLDEIIGQYCPKVMHGLEKPYPGCPLEEAMEKGNSIEREFFDLVSGIWMKSAVYKTDYLTKDGKPIFIHTTQDITEKKQSEEIIKRKCDIEAVLNSLLNLSLQELSLQEILNQTLDLVLSIPWLSLEARGAILLTDVSQEFLIMTAQKGLAEPIQKACARVPFGRCLCGKAASAKEIQFADRLDERHETSYVGIIDHGHYCIPILSRNRVLGVINLYLKVGHLRDKKEEEFLGAVGHVLAGIIERKRAEEQLAVNYNQLQKVMAGTIQAISSIIEVRDPYTAGHQQRVAGIAYAIAKEMGFSEMHIEGIRIAGIIHDIGKISVPAEFLSKPGKLTETEFNVIKTHAQVGYDILKSIEFPLPIAQIVYQHHERMNGSGYPQGLSEKDILIEAKILGVADVVEAMSSHRPYRPALGIEKALEEIRRNRGVLYDANVADACLKIFIQGNYHL